MRDHTYLGVPVSQISDDDLRSLLARGRVRILSSDGLSDDEANYWAMMRLEIEDLIRRLNLR